MKSLDVLEVTVGSVVTFMFSDFFLGFAFGVSLMIIAQALAYGW